MSLPDNGWTEEQAQGLLESLNLDGGTPKWKREDARSFPAHFAAISAMGDETRGSPIADSHLSNSGEAAGSGRKTCQHLTQFRAARQPGPICKKERPPGLTTPRLRPQEGYGCFNVRRRDLTNPASRAYRSIPANCRKNGYGAGARATACSLGENYRKAGTQKSSTGWSQTEDGGLSWSSCNV